MVCSPGNWPQCHFAARKRRASRYKTTSAFSPPRLQGNFLSKAACRLMNKKNPEMAAIKSRRQHINNTFTFICDSSPIVMQAWQLEFKCFWSTPHSQESLHCYWWLSSTFKIWPSTCGAVQFKGIVHPKSNTLNGLLGPCICFCFFQIKRKTLASEMPSKKA